MTRQILRLSVTLIGIVAMLLVASGAASAAPEGPTGNGVMEPKGLADVGCPWPDGANGFMESIGVEKCLPQMIAWTDGHGARIVTDPMVAIGSAGDGWVTFWCQSNVGFKYRIIVSDLAPHTTYPVTATEGTGSWDLGALRTDASGGAVLGGLIRLGPGEYTWSITVGNALQTIPADPVGFAVF